MLPALYLLWRFCYEGERRLWLWLALLVLPLPLLHTHSALALVLLCLVSGLYTLTQGARKRDAAALAGAGRRLRRGMAFFQMLPTVLAQGLDGQQMLRLHFNWINGRNDGTLKDSYLWFYIKNIGLVYLLLIPAFVHAKPKQRWLYDGGLAILALAELVVFQPNNYDNNKLLYVWHMLGCVLVAQLAGRPAWVKVAPRPGGRGWRPAVFSHVRQYADGRAGASERPTRSHPRTSRWRRFVDINAESDALFLTSDNHLAGRRFVRKP